MADINVTETIAVAEALVYDPDKVYIKDVIKVEFRSPSAAFFELF